MTFQKSSLSKQQDRMVTTVIPNMGTGSVQLAVLSWSPEGLAGSPVWPLHPVLMMLGGAGAGAGEEGRREEEGTVCVVGTHLHQVGASLGLA